MTTMLRNDDCADSSYDRDARSSAISKPPPPNPVTDGAAELSQLIQDWVLFRAETGRPECVRSEMQLNVEWDAQRGLLVIEIHDRGELRSVFLSSWEHGIRWASGVQGQWEIMPPDLDPGLPVLDPRNEWAAPWRERIPADVLVFLEPFTAQRWALLYWVSRSRAALELLRSEPKLLWLVLMTARRDHWPEARISACLHLQRREILASCGLYPDDSTVALLAKMHCSPYDRQSFEWMVPWLQSRDRVQSLDDYPLVTAAQLRFLRRFPEAAGSSLLRTMPDDPVCYWTLTRWLAHPEPLDEQSSANDLVQRIQVYESQQDRQRESGQRTGEPNSSFETDAALPVIDAGKLSEEEVNDALREPSPRPYPALKESYASTSSEDDLGAEPEHREMTFTLVDEDADAHRAVLRVIGVGRLGREVVNHPQTRDIGHVDFAFIDSETEANAESLFCAVSPWAGESAKPRHATEYASTRQDNTGETCELEDWLVNTDLLILVVDPGCPDDAAVARRVAEMSMRIGTLTVALAVMPFPFDGSERRSAATAGYEALVQAVDTAIIVPSAQAAMELGALWNLPNAFAAVQNTLLNTLRAIADFITAPGLICVDFADARTVLAGMGKARVGFGAGKGESAACNAVGTALGQLSSDTDLLQARGVLVNLSGGLDLPISAFDQVAATVSSFANGDGLVTVSACIFPELEGQIRVTVIATGFESGL